jgi:hypothetical protein
MVPRNREHGEGILGNRHWILVKSEAEIKTKHYCIASNSLYKKIRVVLLNAFLQLTYPSLNIPETY